MKKYNWILPPIVFSMVLVFSRVIYSGTFMYLFLVWNLFLALLPVYFSLKAREAKQSFKLLVYSCAWLLFFPNSMYIVTDLFHLSHRPPVQLWYDLLLLFSTAVNGVVLGFLSLSNMEEVFSKYRVGVHRRIIVFCLMLLCGYGIYLGRFERWNSWDLIFQPYWLLYDIASDIIHPYRNKDVWALTLLFGTWMYLLYIYALKFKDAVRSSLSKE